ncbi:SIS domain-containing protein [Virgibacillus sp. MSJ-26]|uniref:SIS domain-containing protein n=1 Tax=Virgibacillus sp. MSJ-26 TaxID=2841522 RepID=UPI001C119012|nr:MULTISPECIES: SIS domain-containing protein [unclassified Virgibacillus]MBU5468708.1 SIS domain-containing protein [Virgibacillus sp. MSJ-26]HLR69215.1 SIS domain-containing protein [Virgibacillus sp.]
MIHNYFSNITDLLKKVEKEEQDVLTKASKKVSESIQNDGVVHLFGCGHSHILTEEVYYRAGGLVPIHPILHEPLMLHEGAVRSSSLERENDYAHKFMEQQDIRTGDVIFVISTSGRNPVPVDVAKIAKQKGAYVIGITSIEYSSSQPSRHTSGKHLFDAVDLVINNHAPIGDALLSYEKVSVKFAPSSTVIGATILNAILAESIKHMADSNYNPPIFLSGNIEGADEHNNKLIEKYKGRVKL